MIKLIIFVVQNLNFHFQSAKELEAKFPGRILFVRYEDLSLNPSEMVKHILKFLHLPMRKQVMDFISTHTTKDDNKHNPHTVTRNSSATPFKWRGEMSWKDILEIQDDCRYTEILFTQLIPLPSRILQYISTHDPILIT